MQYFTANEFHIIATNRSLIFGIKPSNARSPGVVDSTSEHRLSGMDVPETLLPHQRNDRLFVIDVMLYSVGDGKCLTDYVFIRTGYFW